MRVLMSCMPFAGHLNPILSLGEAIRAAGHDVCVATDELGKGAVQAAGAELLPIDLGIPPLPDTLDDTRQLSDGWWNPYPRWEHELREPLRDWNPDVVVRDRIEPAALTIAQEAGVPCVSVATMAIPAPDQRAGGELWLNPYPPALGGTGRDAMSEADEHHIRPLLDDFFGDGLLPDWLAAPRDRPLVYATLGTILNRTRTVFPVIVDALAGLDVDLLLTIGRDRASLGLGELPSNVHVGQYVPHQLLFPLCDVFVGPGGFSTMLGALAHGVPLCLIPLACNDTVHAERCAALGAGMVHPVPAGGSGFVELDAVSPTVVRTMVECVLTDPSYARAAQRLQAEIERLPDRTAAVDLIEAFVERVGSVR